MRPAAINTVLVDEYIGLLSNLSPVDKLDIIAKLTTSVKSDLDHKKSTFEKAFGAFESDKSAEAIIDEIRSSRVFNRQTESF